MSEIPNDTFGFLTVVEDATHGLFGGYLLLNSAGRPVEFHCTAPVKPSRPQQILYGPTLKSYLYGEQIAAALIEKSRITPQVLFFDQASALCVRECISVPAILVEKTETEAGIGHRIPWKTYYLSAYSRFDADLETGKACLQETLLGLDLMEPFDRIREAIAEAQKSAVS